jgi:hypothetical protein
VGSIDEWDTVDASVKDPIRAEEADEWVENPDPETWGGVCVSEASEYVRCSPLGLPNPMLADPSFS